MTQSGPRANRSTPEGQIAFDPAIYDVTSYEKADIIKLRNDAFRGDVKYAKKVRAALIGLPFVQIPTIWQINSSELFTLHAPFQVSQTTMIKMKDLQKRPTFTAFGYHSSEGMEPLETVRLPCSGLQETGLKCTLHQDYRLTLLWE